MENEPIVTQPIEQEPERLTVDQIWEITPMNQKFVGAWLALGGLLVLALFLFQLKP